MNSQLFCGGSFPIGKTLFCSYMASLEAMVAALDDMFEIFAQPDGVMSSFTAKGLEEEAEVIAWEFPALFTLLELALGIDPVNDPRAGILFDFVFGCDVGRLRNEPLNEVIANPSSGRLGSIESYEELYDYLTSIKH